MIVGTSEREGGREGSWIAEGERQSFRGGAGKVERVERSLRKVQGPVALIEGLTMVGGTRGLERKGRNREEKIYSLKAVLKTIQRGKGKKVRKGPISKRRSCWFSSLKEEGDIRCRMGIEILQISSVKGEGDK